MSCHWFISQVPITYWSPCRFRYFAKHEENGLYYLCIAPPQGQPRIALPKGLRIPYLRSGTLGSVPKAGEEKKWTWQISTLAFVLIDHSLPSGSVIWVLLFRPFVVMFSKVVILSHYVLYFLYPIESIVTYWSIPLSQIEGNSFK